MSGSTSKVVGILQRKTNSCGEMRMLGFFGRSLISSSSFNFNFNPLACIYCRVNENGRKYFSSSSSCSSGVKAGGNRKQSFLWKFEPSKLSQLGHFYSTNATTHSQSIMFDGNDYTDDGTNVDRENYFVDNTFITRHNKKWLTKKNKKPKEKRVKVVAEYKEIRDSTYDELVHTFPQLDDFDREEVKLAMAEAAFYGLTPTKVAKILSRYPEFIYNYQTLLPQSAKAWRALGFSEADRANFFHRNPALMSISPEIVAKGYKFLSHYFSNKELVLMIKTNPRVVVEHENVLTEKMNYLWKKYSHSTLAIAQSEAISRDINHIECRHEFLIRAGLLKTIPHHKFLKLLGEADRRRIPVVRDKYFTPGIVVCSSDEKFLAVCTANCLSAMELTTFEEFLLQEKENEEFYASVEIENELAFKSAVEVDSSWLESNQHTSDVQSDKSESEIYSDTNTQDSSEENISLDLEAEDAESTVDYHDKRYYHKGGNSFALFNIVDAVDFYF